MHILGVEWWPEKWIKSLGRVLGIEAVGKEVTREVRAKMLTDPAGTVREIGLLK